ncbi:MAG: hypothetical protein A3D17_08185 [Bdellovibrionales bacterium RIFCSPHIGHO2_02_FULL_40_15]|nr:MAG: hypothetical protein A3D17_08185 [Bdellovibrionales bacterium RIFCSPHIGHO2_02_FULL_40_15]
MITTLLFSTLGFAADALKLSDLKKIFIQKKLDKYISEGQVVMKYLDKEFKRVANPTTLDGGFAVEYFDLEYKIYLRPTQPDPFVSLTELTADTNALLDLHKRYYSQIKRKVFLRNYFQTAFIGMVNTLEALRKVQVGVPRDGYSVLSNLILEQGRLITSTQKDFVTMTDFWWDYIWAHYMGSPVDLIELGNQKLRGVWLNEKRDTYKRTIEKFLAGYSMFGLRKGLSPAVYRDITNQIYLQLSKNAYEIYALRNDQPALAKARVFKYIYETKLGLTEDAERTKREIAKEGLKIRIKRLWNGPREALYSEQNSMAINGLKALRTFLYNFYFLIRYLIGFLLITFPFDAALIVAGLIILSVEGRVIFQDEFWPTTRRSRKKNVFLNVTHNSIKILNNFFARIINDIIFGFRMLFHYYTSDETNRNIRIGSSLLIFGMGLFFSSARTIVETFVSQLSL